MNCYASEWLDYISHSPDHFSDCLQQVPNNAFGYQQPYDGTAYMGLYTMIGRGVIANYREIIGVKLKDSLTIGETYYVSLRVSLAECINCATNNLGALFSTTPIIYTASIILPNHSHVYSTSIITDTLNWINISGSFVADSNYKYIFVGNFFDNAHTDSILTRKHTCWGELSYCAAYYYIDDVCVSSDPLACDLSPTSLKIRSDVDNVKIFPNPFSDELFIKSDQKNSIGLRIVDMLGKAIFTYQSKNSSITKLDVSSISEGIYFLEVIQDNNRYIHKLIKSNKVSIR